MTAEHEITLTGDATDEVRGLLRTLDVQVQAAIIDGAAGRLLRAILRPGYRLSLECPAADEGHGLLMARLLNYETGEGGAVVSGPDLVECLDRVAAQLELRRCTRCGKIKPAAEFSRLLSGPGGWNRSCRRCEAARVADYARRKLAERDAARAEAGEPAPPADPRHGTTEGGPHDA